MEQATPVRAGAGYSTVAAEYGVSSATNSSGLSWAAILGGGVVIAALSLLLLSLGTGLGLSSVSVWSNQGVSASTLGAGAIVWLIAMQVISSSLGGYLAGRLRIKWATIHTDEVYFRDTAHGFLAWSLAFVVTAAFLATASTVIVGAAASSAVGAKAGAEAAEPSGPNDYYIDTLFRSDAISQDANGAAMRAEVGPIFANALENGSFSGEDRTYLARVIAAKTGLSQEEADKRITNVLTQAQQAAEATRKAIAHSLLWAFLALLIGAFSASFAATVGGRQRDHVVTV